MILSQKETAAIEDLKTQEMSCITKYKKYMGEAKDPVLKDLFTRLADYEQKHYDILDQILTGKLPASDGSSLAESKDMSQAYQPNATYDSLANSDDKKHDCFLATDCIGTEKLVSGEYNSDVFIFGDSNLRKVLANILIEEQHHAEMLWKYKTVNGMAA